MPSHAELVRDVLERVLLDSRRVVVSLTWEQDAPVGLIVDAEGDAPASSWSDLSAWCSGWSVEAASGRTRLELRPDPARVTAALDSPDTLFALHELARRHPRARLILRLPPSHVGRSR